MSREHRKFHAALENTTFQNLQTLRNDLPYCKPIVFKKCHVHRHHKNTSHQKQPNVLVIKWPRGRSFFLVRELTFLTWFVMEIFFWMHAINIFPNGSGMELEQPPWKCRSLVPLPKDTKFVIEPDWNSYYKRV